MLVSSEGVVAGNMIRPLEADRSEILFTGLEPVNDYNVYLLVKSIVSKPSDQRIKVYELKTITTGQPFKVNQIRVQDAPSAKTTLEGSLAGGTTLIITGLFSSEKNGNVV